MAVKNAVKQRYDPDEQMARQLMQAVKDARSGPDEKHAMIFHPSGTLHCFTNKQLQFYAENYFANHVEAYIDDRHLLTMQEAQRISELIVENFKDQMRAEIYSGVRDNIQEYSCLGLNLAIVTLREDFALDDDDMERFISGCRRRSLGEVNIDSLESVYEYNERCLEKNGIKFTIKKQEGKQMSNAEIVEIYLATPNRGRQGKLIELAEDTGKTVEEIEEILRQSGRVPKYSGKKQAAEKSAKTETVTGMSQDEIEELLDQDDIIGIEELVNDIFGVENENKPVDEPVDEPKTEEIKVEESTEKKEENKDKAVDFEQVGKFFLELGMNKECVNMAKSKIADKQHEIECNGKILDELNKQMEAVQEAIGKTQAAIKACLDEIDNAQNFVDLIEKM